MAPESLHKLIGSIAETIAEGRPGFKAAETQADELREVRAIYEIINDWSAKQMAALTELIEQHEQIRHAGAAK